MVLRCCVNSCKTEYDGITSFHSFPLASPELLKKWLDAIPNCPEQPTKTHRVCSRHFSTDSFTVTEQRTRLKNYAVPNIFPKFIVTSVVSTSCHNNAEPVDESHKSVDKAVQIQVSTKDVAVQTSPRLLKNHAREQQLQRQIKILQQRLRRREAKEEKDKSHLDTKKTTKPQIGCPSTRIMTVLKAEMDWENEDNVS